MMLFNHSSQTQAAPSTESEPLPVRDQADGLRQLRRVDDPHPRDHEHLEQLEHDQEYDPDPLQDELSVDQALIDAIDQSYPSANSDILKTDRIKVHQSTDDIAAAHRADGALGQARVLPWPRIVIVSEFPSTDVGARFAWHLVHSLSGGAPSQAKNLLIDLSPAASRLPHVLADCVPSTGYAPLWSQLASGRPLSVQTARLATAVAVAAESQSHPCALDQLPRVYEQLVRQLSRHTDRWRWIVLLAMDSVVPLDRACWQAADDVILLHGAESTGCQRQAAALRNRIEEDDPRRCIWTLPKRRVGWRSIFDKSFLSGLRNSLSSGFADMALSTRWLEAGIATQLLPAVAWPEQVYGVASEQQLREGSRIDRALMRSARGVADALRLSAACQSSNGLLSFDGAQKKIQLGTHLRPIRESSDEFRA